jgi:hypothetical protein
VLGISSTVVTPPRSAAAVPVAIVSLCSRPGSRKWTCESMTPGSTCSPGASNLSAATQACKDPSSAIRPSRMPRSISNVPQGVTQLPPVTMRSKLREAPFTSLPTPVALLPPRALPARSAVRPSSHEALRGA